MSARNCSWGMIENHLSYAVAYHTFRYAIHSFSWVAIKKVSHAFCHLLIIRLPLSEHADFHSSIVHTVSKTIVAWGMCSLVVGRKSYQVNKSRCTKANDWSKRSGILSCLVCRETIGKSHHICKNKSCFQWSLFQASKSRWKSLSTLSKEMGRTPWIMDRRLVCHKIAICFIIHQYVVFHKVTSKIGFLYTSSWIWRQIGDW